MDLTKEDIQGVVDRAITRWANVEGEFSYQMTRVVDQDLAIAGKKLVNDGGTLCANLRLALSGHQFPNEIPLAIDRWNMRAVTFEKAVKASPENTPGRLEFAVDLVAAGKNLAMLLEALAPQPCEPPAPKDEDPLVARIRAELWAPGKLPTPESVAAFVGRFTFDHGVVTNDEAVFLDAVVVELARAKVKYPDPRRRFAALVSEIGEVATAFLKETPDRVYEEAVQVAVVALRIATEGDPTLEPV